MSAKINRNIKYFCYFLELIILFVIQNAPGVFPEILGVVPMLLIPAAITMAMLESETEAVFIGAVAGLIVDISFGAYFGLFGAIMSVICCFSSYVIKRFNITIYSASLVGAIAVLICGILDWTFRYVLLGYSSVWIMLIDKYLPIYFYSILVLPLLYVLNLGIYSGLKSVAEDIG